MSSEPIHKASQHELPLLEARSLAVRIGELSLCENLNLSVGPGECVVILGRNGAGKTTLLKTLAGLHAPDAGAVELSGSSYAALGLRNAARLRAFLPQGQFDAFPSTVLETALVGRHPHLSRWGWESAVDVAIAREALAVLGLDTLAEREVMTLSGGERQRLAIAAHLTQQAPLGFLDEPLAHLDINYQIAVLELLRKLTESGSSMLMVLHDVNLAARYADRVVLLMGDGRSQVGSVKALLTPATLEALYGHPFVAAQVEGRAVFFPA